MNAFRFAACIKEFPGLKEILEKKSRMDHQKVSSIRIQRTDENFFKRTLAFVECGDPYHWEELWAILPFQDPILVPTKNEDTVSKGMWPDGRQDLYSGEPVVEALPGFEDAKFLVLLVWDTPRLGVELFDVSIYKPGRISIAEAIACAREEARALVKAQIRGEEE